MTTPVWIEFVCARCSKTSSGRFVFKGQIPMRAVKEQARKEGFKFDHGEAFCSAACQHRWEQDCPCEIEED